MLINEILRIKGNVLYTTPPNAAVLSAVKVMAQHDIGSLVVMDRGQKAGIVTFAEVLRAFRGWPMYKILGVSVARLARAACRRKESTLAMRP